MDVKLLDRLESEVQNHVGMLLTQIKDEGSLEHQVDNIWAYHQLPLLLVQCGYTEIANRVLHYIDQTFFDEQHLFAKSAKKDVPVVEGITKVASAIGVAAHLCGRFDISYKIQNRLRQYYHPDEGAFTACAPFDNLRSVLDFNASSNLGYFFLVFGDLNKAKRAGNFLQRVQSLQTHMNEFFYLRIDDDGKLISSFAKEYQSYYAILTGKAHQNYDTISLACRFLAKLYWASDDDNYLRLSQSLFEYGLTNESATHAMALSAAVLANVTHIEKYKDYAVDYLSENLDKKYSVPDTKEGYQTLIHNTFMFKEMIAELSLL